MRNKFFPPFLYYVIECTWDGFEPRHLSIWRNGIVYFIVWTKCWIPENPNFRHYRTNFLVPVIKKNYENKFFVNEKKEKKILKTWKELITEWKPQPEKKHDRICAPQLFLLHFIIYFKVNFCNVKGIAKNERRKAIYPISFRGR